MSNLVIHEWRLSSLGAKELVDSLRQQWQYQITELIRKRGLLVVYPDRSIAVDDAFNALEKATARLSEGSVLRKKIRRPKKRV